MNSSASQSTPLRMAVCLSVHRLEHLDRLAACFLARREGGGRACHVFAAANRPATFTKTEADNTTIVECGYDYMGRRCIKKITVNGVITLHQRYIYRGYLQIACVDLTRSSHPGLWLITWDPAQPTATRPLAIQKNGTWYTYGHDLTKNVTELYNTNGTIATAYDYTPFGQVTATGTADQPIQWSSEYNDTELGLIYYNYRHYNPQDGRWINRDTIFENGGWNLYGFVANNPSSDNDYLGEKSNKEEDIRKCKEVSNGRMKELAKHRNFKGCKIEIDCQYTDNPPSYAITEGLKIIIYIPKCLSSGDVGLLNTINHELVHAYDNCKKGGIQDCESMWYGEIRGSYYGQCAQIKNEDTRKRCAIKGAKRSVKGNLEAMKKSIEKSNWNSGIAILMRKLLNDQL